MADRRTRNVVACAGCTLCCRNDAIIMHPEDGDDPAAYLTVSGINPLNGKPVTMLAKGADGNCVYLDPAKGCSIYSRAPAVCRTFSCANLYRTFGAANLARMVAAGAASADVVDAGRKRLKSSREEGKRANGL